MPPPDDQNAIPNVSNAAEILRSLAGRLDDLAHAIDRRANLPRKPVTLVSCEAEQQHLLRFAEGEYRARRKRSEFVEGDLLGEPAWDILLDLFIQGVRNKRISVSSACKASACPDTTALRWLASLEAKTLVERECSDLDRRVQFVRLSEAGMLAVSSWLRYRISLAA